VLVSAAGLILLYLSVKMATKFFGILPLTRMFRFDPKEGMYTTLLMSTGLTFGSILALFGLTNHIIDERQYTILLTAVVGSAVVPTLIGRSHNSLGLAMSAFRDALATTLTARC
jgi:Kef-type K+ transport system membrane component KefB